KAECPTGTHPREMVWRIEGPVPSHRAFDLLRRHVHEGPLCQPLADLLGSDNRGRSSNGWSRAVMRRFSRPTTEQRHQGVTPRNGKNCTLRAFGKNEKSAVFYAIFVILSERS